MYWTYVLFLLSVMTVISSCIPLSGNWNSLIWSVSHNVTLPREDHNMAVAYFNETLFLFGGQSFPSQAVTFDIVSKTITDLGDDYLSFKLYGNSRYYTQINHLFYAIDPAEPHMFIYNLMTKQLSYTDIMNQNVGQDGCVTSLDNLLFVIGGMHHDSDDTKDPLNNTQIYNVSSNQWTIGAFMHTPRAYHTCVVDPIRSDVYVIGGISTNNGDGMNTIEKISIDEILMESAGWTYIQSLSEGVTSASAVMIKSTHQIYVCCGLSFGSWDFHIITAQVIHCDYGSVTSLPHDASAARVYAATIYAHNTIYAFGGSRIGHHDYYYYGLYDVNSWASLHLFPTNAPTSAPTPNPTFTTSFNNQSMRVTKTSITVTDTGSPSLDRKNKEKDLSAVMVIVVLLLFVCCLVITVGYMRQKHIGREKEGLKREDSIDLGYVELPEGYAADGQTNVKNVNNADRDEDEIYCYAPPSDVHDHGEDDVPIFTNHATSNGTAKDQSQY